MQEQDLTLVGLTEDRQRLVLVNDAGDEFTLAADARLRAALRGDHARLGQLEITMDSSIRPRDIQARIRAGESPEQVAAAAQTTLDKVIGFATPVLAERAHIADRAQRASVRRQAGEATSGVLADTVAERLRGRSVDPAAVEWDSWRRDDGRWTVVADYRSGESLRHAEFVFDAPGRYVVADDDEARWLVGEPSSLTGPQPRVGPGPRRLSAVSRDDDELPLGEDALEMVSEPADPAGQSTQSTESQQSSQSMQSGQSGQTGATADADWMATQAAERSVDLPAQPVEPALEISPVELGSEADVRDEDDEDESARAAGHGAESVPGQGAERGAAEPDQAQETTTGSEPDGAERRPARKNRRASVPSWDEIMFGGGKQD